MTVAAAGMVSVHCRCTLEQAEDLSAARAFADASPLSEIALAIVQGSLRFVLSRGASGCAEPGRLRLC